MTKSAIEKMVEYSESWIDSGIKYSRGQIIEAMVNKSRELAAEEKYNPAPVEAKATAKGSSVPCQVNDFDNDGPCPHMNKDGTIPCAYIKKDCPSYRPASPAVEELVREMRKLAEEHELSANYNVQSLVAGINDAIDKYDNAKGGK